MSDIDADKEATMTCCNAPHSSFACTRELGHEGPHVALTNANVFCDAWVDPEPAPRIITADEIREGDRIRVEKTFRDRVESHTGTAHHRDFDGNWFTERDCWLLAEHPNVTIFLLARPEPEDSRVDVLEGTCLRDGVVLTRADAAMLLSITDKLDAAKAGESDE